MIEAPQDESKPDKRLGKRERHRAAQRVIFERPLPMTASELRDIGHLITNGAPSQYWVAAIAQITGRTKRAVHNWLADKRPIDLAAARLLRIKAGYECVNLDGQDGRG